MPKLLRMLVVVFMLLLLALTTSAYADDAVAWNTKPVITAVYEQEAGKVYVEWTGAAPAYWVYMDGKQIQTVPVPSAIVDMSRGTHVLKIVPIHKTDGSSFNFGVSGLGKLGLGLDVDLNTTEMESGVPSESVSINFMPDQLFTATPETPRAAMNLEDQVVLTFTDIYSADEYQITIKSGRDAWYFILNMTDTSIEQYLQQDGYNVSVCLKPELLTDKGYW